MESSIIQRRADDHGGKIRVNGRTLTCYTKRQLTAFCPHGYTPAAECLATDLTGDAQNDRAALRPYRTYSRLRYAVRGFWRADDGRYVALLMPALAGRLLILFAVLVLAAGAVLAARFWPGGPAADPNPTPSIGEIDPGAQDYTGEKTRPDKGDPTAANTQIPGYKTIEIDAESGELSIAPHCPAGNPCYFAISLIVDGKTIYKSGLIAPGQALYHVKVSEIPPKGTYTATMKYDCYHLTTKTPLNGAQIEVQLIVS